MQTTTWKDLCWRWASPVNLIGAAMLFFLPWIEGQRHAAVRSWDQVVPVQETLITQSGFQAAYDGTYTKSQSHRSNSPAAESAAFYYGATGREPKSISPEHEQRVLQKARKPLPLLAVYGVLLVVGITAGIIRKRGWTRPVAVTIASATAFLVLFVQARSNFPIADFVEEENALLAEVHKEYEEIAITRGPPTLVMRFTWCYYAAFVLPAIAAVVVLGEGWVYRIKGNVPVSHPPTVS
jgi:hypothetical protein